MKQSPITIVVEFGGLISAKKFPDVGEPIEGALDALNKLKEVGKEVLKKHLLSLNSEKIGIFLLYQALRPTGYLLFSCKVPTELSPLAGM